MAPCRSRAALQAAKYRHFLPPRDPSRSYVTSKRRNKIASAPECSEARNQGIAILPIGPENKQAETLGGTSPSPFACNNRLLPAASFSPQAWLAQWCLSSNRAALLATQTARGAGGRKLSTMPLSTGPYCSRSAAVHVAFRVNSLLYLQGDAPRWRGKLGAGHPTQLASHQ